MKKIKWQTFEVASSLAQSLRKERWREIEASLGVEQVRKVTRVKLLKLRMIFDSLE